MTARLRTLMLCADDFGQSPGISQGIAQLAHAGRLSATSCLTNGAHWPAQSPTLRALPQSVQRGLHVNLTEGAPLSPELRRVWPVFPPLPKLILQAHLGRLPQAAIAAEFEAQLAAFGAGARAGHAPDFIDGHQHVHHLPGVRDVLLDALGRMATPPAVRSTARPLGVGFGVKRFLIAQTGGVALQRRLAHRRIRHNASLLGVYDFEAVDYRTLMQGWLALLPTDGGLLFCHPGVAGADAADDPIAAARVRELAYLASPAFSDDLAAAEVQLGPVWQLSETSRRG